MYIKAKSLVFTTDREGQMQERSKTTRSTNRCLVKSSQIPLLTSSLHTQQHGGTINAFSRPSEVHNMCSDL